VHSQEYVWLAQAKTTTTEKNVAIFWLNLFLESFFNLFLEVKQGCS
jgi:hypothetical protein